MFYVPALDAGLFAYQKLFEGFSASLKRKQADINFITILYYFALIPRRSFGMR